MELINQIDAEEEFLDELAQLNLIDCASCKLELSQHLLFSSCCLSVTQDRAIADNSDWRWRILVRKGLLDTTTAGLA